MGLARRLGARPQFVQQWQESLEFGNGFAK
jgi:hypothetical protein